MMPGGGAQGDLLTASHGPESGAGVHFACVTRIKKPQRSERSLVAIPLQNFPVNLT
jgi:hypothetical protein